MAMNSSWSRTPWGGYTRVVSQPKQTTAMANLQASQDKANAANQERLSQATAEYDKIIAQYQPGGGYGAGVEAQIERGAEKSVAQGAQNLVSSGTFNTTQTAGLRKKYEEEVGTPARLSLEQIRQDKLAEAYQGKAGLIERVSDTGPDPMSIANLAMQASRGSTSGRTATNYNTKMKSPSWLTNALNKSMFS